MVDESPLDTKHGEACGIYFQTEVMMPDSCFQHFKQYTYSKTTSDLLFPLPNIILMCSQKMCWILGVLLAHAGKLRFGAHCSFVRKQHVQKCQPCRVEKKKYHHRTCQN